MNPLNPVKHVIEAITFPFTALFVVGICYVVNMMTSPGDWWVQWVAFGMGIALIGKWAKAIKTLIGAAVVGGLGYAAYRWFQKRNASTQPRQTTETPVNSASTVVSR